MPIESLSDISKGGTSAFGGDNLTVSDTAPVAPAVDDVWVDTASAGLGTASTADLTTSATDTTAGRVLKVGDFGLGSTAGNTTSGTDFDTLLATGFYIVTAPVNAPENITTNVMVFGNSGGSGRAFQLAQSVTTLKFYLRSQSSGVWSPWRAVYNQASILGTVSQSAGIPTGAIIERGSNANGEFVRYADGTQICTLRRQDTSVAISTAFQGGFRSTSSTWVYPASFSVAPAITTNPEGLSAFGTSAVVPQTLSSNYIYLAPASQAAANVTITLTAIGRWFS